MPSKHLTYANVTATLALFVALGGSSYAALNVGSEDVRDGSLTGRDVRNGSLAAADLGESATAARRRGRRGARGRRGPRGPAGPAGVAGPPGPSGATNAVVRILPIPSSPGGDPNPPPITGSRECEAGERAIGGGFSLASASDKAVESVPTFTGDPATTGGATPTGWSVTIASEGPAGVSGGFVYVICAKP
jgi:hypothetical protein